MCMSVSAGRVDRPLLFGDYHSCDGQPSGDCTARYRPSPNVMIVHHTRLSKSLARAQDRNQKGATLAFPSRALSSVHGLAFPSPFELTAEHMHDFDSAKCRGLAPPHPPTFGHERLHSSGFYCAAAFPVLSVGIGGVGGLAPTPGPWSKSSRSRRSEPARSLRCARTVP
jgi:hypothetical protein